ncbi:MAG TPA: substrate-binding domain-containing protein [Burkholderiales bacterium]|nr:substrate-binding domain-containing protein [Burkholderiales bacterium]
MLKFEIRPEWGLKGGGEQAQRLRQLFELLAAVAAEGNLTKACAHLAISYRHAWGVVRRGGELFGTPLVSSGRGRRAQLTAFGEKLVWANRRIAARLTPLLENIASELESELKLVAQESGAALRIQASHAFAVAALHAYLRETGTPVDLRYVGSAEAIAALSRGACDLAGFHVPLGSFEAEALQSYSRWLKPRRHVLINVVTRRQGLIVARGNPAGIASIADLARPGLRYVDRQAGSGTRLLLGMLLRQAGMDASQISGFDVAEHTHAAVAAYIASGMADAGLGVETAARQFQLGFVPLVNERYFLVCRKDALQSAPIQGILAAMRGAEFKRRLADLQGLDGIDCGKVIPVAEAFPAFEIARPRAS